MAASRPGRQPPAGAARIVGPPDGSARRVGCGVAGNRLAMRQARPLHPRFRGETVMAAALHPLDAPRIRAARAGFHGAGVRARR